MTGLAVGVASALATGSLPLGGLLGLLVEFSGRRPLPGIGWLSLAISALGLGLLALGVELEAVLAGGLGWFIVHQRSTQRRPDTEVLLVGLLLVVCATRTRSPWFGVAVTAWVLGLPASFGSPGWLALPLFAVGLPVFLLVPRFVPADLRERDARALTGFTGDLELGRMHDLLDDPARVFEAHFDQPVAGPVYFRGVALDRFDGRRWWTEAARRREPAYDGELQDAVRMEVQLEAHPEGVLFLPGTVDGVDADGLAVERDEGGAYHLPGPARMVRYTAWVRPSFGPGRRDPFRDAQPLLAVPELPVEIPALVAGVVGEADGADDRMQALAGWLREDFAYTREPRDLDAEAPLARFLLETRAGHCEYFASALALTGRLAGVPTRVVNGFVGGEWSDTSTLVVRRYHAHSWVEYFDGEQWVSIDPTPDSGAPVGPGLYTVASEQLEAFWQDLVGYDGEQQVRAAREVAVGVRVPGVPPALIGMVLIGLTVGVGVLGVRRLVVRVVLPRPSVGAPDPVSALLEQARTALAAEGLVPPAHLPELAAADWIEARDPVRGAPYRELVWLAYDVRFGGQSADGLLKRARALLDAVRNAA